MPLSAPNEIVRFTAASESVIDFLVAAFKSKVTCPLFPTVAIVDVPSVNVNPSVNLTLLVVPTLAL